MKNLIRVGQHTINMDNVTRATKLPRKNKEVVIHISFAGDHSITLTGIEALEFSEWLDKNSIKIKET